jgi:Ca-activated chloride channel family protein
MPGAPTGQAGSGWSPDTTQVRDASRVSPPVSPEGKRAGHDISIVVHLNAGMKIGTITSAQHEVSVKRSGESAAEVSLLEKESIPNRDFVLKWQVSENELKSGYLCHRAKDSGYFALMIVPPAKIVPQEIAPRELVFVVDTSGSMSGEPIAKVRQTMDYAIDRLDPKDTFRIIAFANSVRDFADVPLPATPQNKDKAHGYIRGLEGSGGTWMAPAVAHACKLPAAENRLRIVSLMSDGYIGNDDEIITMVRMLRAKSRWFPFGVGSSVNRYLIDSVAKSGGGEPDFVLLNSDGKVAAEKFYKRIAAPVLTDVRLKFEGVKVSQVYPASVADVWQQKPLYFVGKYDAAGKGYAVLSGFRAGQPYSERLAIDLPAVENGNTALPSVWARAKVAAISEVPRLAQSPLGIHTITNVALAHHLVTKYTSFVAVEEKTVTEPGKPPRKLVVPVEMPQGVSWEYFRDGNFIDASGAAGGTLMSSANALSIGGASGGITISGPVLAAGGAGGTLSLNGSINTAGGGGGGSYGVSSSLTLPTAGSLRTFGDLTNSGTIAATGGHISLMCGSESELTGYTPISIPDPTKLDEELQSAMVDAILNDTYETNMVHVRVVMNSSQKADWQKYGMTNIKAEGDTISGTIHMNKINELVRLTEVKSISLIETVT